MVRKRIDFWHDGDTGKFTDGKWFRLVRVRAYEKRHPKGKTATRSAAGMSGKSKGFVNVSIVGKDSYGRLLVKLSNKHGSINKRLRNKGYTNKGR